MLSFLRRLNNTNNNIYLKKMKIIKNIFDIFIILLSICYVTINANEIIIKNKLNRENKEYFESIAQLVQIRHYEEFVFKFEEDYYDFSDWPSVNLVLKFNEEAKHISFIGNKNGTVFDFKRSQSGSFFIQTPGALSIKMENITFRNFDLTGQMLLYLIVFFPGENTYLNINNCTFENNYYALFSIVSQALTKEKESLITISNCNF